MSAAETAASATKKFSQPTVAYGVSTRGLSRDKPRRQTGCP